MSMSRETYRHLRNGDYVKQEPTHMGPSACPYLEVLEFDDPERFRVCMVRVMGTFFFHQELGTYQSMTHRLAEELEDAIYRDGERLTFTEGE